MIPAKGASEWMDAERSPRPAGQCRLGARSLSFEHAKPVAERALGGKKLFVYDTRSHIQQAKWSSQF